MRVTSIQAKIENRHKGETLSYMVNLLNQARGSDFVLLPEVWPIGYFSFDLYRDESESIEGPTVTAMREQARKLRTYLHMGSFIERDGERLFNTSLLLNPEGSIAATYRKRYLFGYQSRESEILSRGEEAVVVETPWGRAGLSTCYDLRFPEFFREMVDQGATLFMVAAAWPEARKEAWTLFNRVRAHENLAYLFSCNCAGKSQGTQFAGHSTFVDPLGQVIAQAGESESLLTAEVDPELPNQVRNEFPALQDRLLASSKKKQI